MKLSRLRPWAFVLLLAVPGAAFAQAEAPSTWVHAVQSPQYFAVFVKDVDASVEWYKAALGLKDRDGSQAEDGSWRIANLANERLWVEIIRDNRAVAVVRARGFAKVGFHVPDVRIVADRVKQATQERPRVLTFKDHDVRIIQLKDPDGNIVQLFSPLEQTAE